MTSRHSFHVHFTPSGACMHDLMSSPWFLQDAGLHVRIICNIADCSAGFLDSGDGHEDWSAFLHKHIGSSAGALSIFYFFCCPDQSTYLMMLGSYNSCAPPSSFGQRHTFKPLERHSVATSHGASEMLGSLAVQSCAFPALAALVASSPLCKDANL